MGCTLPSMYRFIQSGYLSLKRIVVLSYPCVGWLVNRDSTLGDSKRTKPGSHIEWLAWKIISLSHRNRFRINSFHAARKMSFHSMFHGNDEHKPWWWPSLLGTTMNEQDHRKTSCYLIVPVPCWSLVDPVYAAYTGALSAVNWKAVYIFRPTLEYPSDIVPRNIHESPYSLGFHQCRARGPKTPGQSVSQRMKAGNTSAN